MKSASTSTPYRYLDASELADLLGLSLRTIILRARHRPWLLPPRAVLSDRELLRWRQDVVEAWLANPPL
jgi:predicted DNA-binding transcriptional regulator AlpA